MKGWRWSQAAVAFGCVVFLAAVGIFFSSSREFADGLETGKLSANWMLDGNLGCEISVTQEMAVTGRYALRFWAPAGSRCEIVPLPFDGLLAKYRHEPFGEDRWYAFSTFLAEPWAANQQNEIVAQWHGARDAWVGDVPSRGPPLAIRIYGDTFRVTHGWDSAFISEKPWLARYALWQGQVQTDAWLHWKVHARWSHRNDGLLRMWLNDELVVDYSGPNTYNDLRGVYLKIGPYHPDKNRLFYLDDVFIGDEDPASRLGWPIGKIR